MKIEDLCWSVVSLLIGCTVASTKGRGGSESVVAVKSRNLLHHPSVAAAAAAAAAATAFLSDNFRRSSDQVNATHFLPLLIRTSDACLSYNYCTPPTMQTSCMSPSLQRVCIANFVLLKCYLNSLRWRQTLKLVTYLQTLPPTFLYRRRRRRRRMMTVRQSRLNFKLGIAQNLLKGSFFLVTVCFDVTLPTYLKFAFLRGKTCELLL
jgi:hypothetical protein